MPTESPLLSPSFGKAVGWLGLLCVLCGLSLAGQAQAQRSFDSKVRESYDSEVEPHQLSMRFAPTREDGPRYHVRRVDDETFVVYRERTGSPGLEGFLIDVPSLLETLHGRVLKGRGLGEVASLHGPGSGPKTTMGSFPYVFQEPFTALKATLSLRPLDADDEGSLLLLLAVILAAVVIMGLIALYRMVAVQVEFTERRSNFVSAVSHELKTPLTAIRMYGELLREGLVESDDKRNEYYGLITSESERLSRLVNNVLELGDIERTTHKRKLVRADLASAVREVMQVMQGQAKERGFELDLFIEEALPAVSYDPDGLRQVLFNLFDNALKYGRGSATKRVEVRCSRVPSGVRLTVRDHGPGVGTAQLPHLFEPFYRAENELTRRHEGVGLGLALVQRIARGMDAQVTCKNAAPGLEISLLFTV